MMRVDIMVIGFKHVNLVGSDRMRASPGKDGLDGQNSLRGRKGQLVMLDMLIKGEGFCFCVWLIGLQEVVVEVVAVDGYT